MRMNRFRDDEQGVTLVIVAITLVILIACAALVIDIGNGWSRRRQLVTTTDAAALAAAQEYATGGDGCTSVAGTYVDNNTPGVTDTTCTLLGSHRVEVTVKDDVEFYLAGALGLAESRETASTTIAGWGPVSEMTGLRPFGLCHLNAQVQDWLADPSGSTPAAVITYQRLPGDAPCGSAPGNWGTFDFDGGSNPTRDQRDWVENGYPGLVRIGNTYSGDTGALSNSVGTELQGLVDSGEIFAIPLFDDVTGTGSGARLRVWGFLGVRLTAFRVNGPEAGRTLTLEFHSLVTSGTYSPTAPDTGISAISICGVDAGDTSGCP